MIVDANSVGTRSLWSCSRLRLRLRLRIFDGLRLMKKVTHRPSLPSTASSDFGCECDATIVRKDRRGEGAPIAPDEEISPMEVLGERETCGLYMFC